MPSPGPRNTAGALAVERGMSTQPHAATGTDYISGPSVIDVTEATFAEEVLRRSHERPVVVDFWAEWCGPCRTLGPVLERLAVEAKGEWVLAKVDVDANGSLAAAAQVQGIPAVRAFRDGRQVDEFTGALPESQVREWLVGLGPQPADLAVAGATEAAEAGDLEAARDGFRRALDLDPGHEMARKGLAEVELRLRTAGQDRKALIRRAADPGDLDAVLGLADLDAASGDLESAFGRLVESVGQTSGPDRERIRVHLLGLLDTLPPDDSRAMTARRSLALALF